VPFAQDVDLRRKAAPASAQGFAFSAFYGRGAPFLAPAACLWARTTVPSMAANSKSMRPSFRPRAWRALTIRCYVASLRQRRNRSWTVDHGP